MLRPLSFVIDRVVLVMRLEEGTEPLVKSIDLSTTGVSGTLETPS